MSQPTGAVPRVVIIGAFTTAQVGVLSDVYSQPEQMPAPVPAQGPAPGPAGR